METEEKIAKAIKFIQAITSQHNVALAFSGGKDSCVLEFLAKESNRKLDLFHNCTTIDPEGTLTYCEKHGAKIIRSELSFLDLVEKKGFPTMFRRFCCKELKERYYADYALFGIRKFESVKRAKCYSDYADIYYYKKNLYTERFFPLLNFTDEDVEYVVNKHSLDCHPLYYDHNGCFQVSRRLGCIGCPLQGDRGKMDYLQYPKLFLQVLRRGVLFHQRMGRTPRDAALNMVYNLFYSNGKIDKYRQTYEGLFDTDPWEILDSYFFINEDLVMSKLPKPKFRRRR